MYHISCPIKRTGFRTLTTEYRDSDRKEGIRNLENSNSKDQVERIQEIYETYSQYQERNRKAQQDD